MEVLDFCDGQCRWLRPDLSVLVTSGQEGCEYREAELPHWLSHHTRESLPALIYRWQES